MSAIWMRFRSDLRSRWRSTLALAVLLGLLGGVVLTAAIGARRTQTAHTRLLQETQALDALVGLVVPPATAAGFYRRIAALPQVSEMQRLPGARVLDVDPSGRIDYSVKSLVPMDTVALRRFGRHKILAGRLPHPDRADEVLVNRPLAQLRDLEVGDTLIGFRAFPGFTHPLALKPSDGVPVTLRIVGIGVAPVEILSDARTPNAAIQTLTPAFYREHVDAVDIAFAGVRLHRGGDDIPAFQDGAERVASVTLGRVPGTPFLFSNAHDGSVRARRAITPQATALALFAILAGLTWTLTVGQAFARQISSEGAGNDRLRALGMTQRQLVAVPLLRAAAVGVIAGGTAVVIATAASPLTPIGTARIAEPNPGFSVNTVWLCVGFVGIVVFMVAVAFLPAWRAAGSSRHPEGVVPLRSDRRSRLGSVRPPWLPITASLGARVALDPGRGRTATPVRSAVIVTMTTIAAVALSVTFATNLSRLVGSPHLYGQDWDTVLDAQVFPIPATEARDILTGDPAIDSFAAGNIGQVVIGSTTVPALGIDSRPGAPYPTLLDGRKATNPDEIVLGTHALERAGARVGDSIRVTVGKRTQTMRITGRAVFPKFALGAFQRPELGNGAAVTSSVLASAGAPDQADTYTFMLVRFRAGVDHASARARLEDAIAQLGPCPFGPCVIADQRPDEVTTYTEIEATPFILTAVLGLLALTTLGHTLVTSVRRRTRDFAVLKTVGLSRRQVSAIVAWQATIVAIAAGVVGVLVGLVLGKWAWTEFAQQLGVATDFTVPGVALVVITPIAVILANLVAAGPGWLAGRVRPATVLRAE